MLLQFPIPCKTTDRVSSTMFGSISHNSSPLVSYLLTSNTAYTYPQYLQSVTTVTSLLVSGTIDFLELDQEAVFVRQVCLARFIISRIRTWPVVHHFNPKNFTGKLLQLKAG